MDLLTPAPPKFFGKVVAVLSVALMQTLHAQESVTELGCLNGVRVGAEQVRATACTLNNPDVLDLRSNPEVSAIIQELGLALVDIRFSGCEGAKYSTNEVTRDGSDRAFVITYAAGDTSAYLAPVAHELAHVFQATAMGGIKALKDSSEGLQIELGADFTAGLLFQRLFEGTHEKNAFQNSLRLIGGFSRDADDFHGRPAQRRSAFRYGASLRRFESDYQGANTNFKENLYGQIVVR